MTNLSIPQAINFLADNNFTVNFEGGISLKMIPLTLNDVENKLQLNTLKKEISFFQRPNKEKLLRLIIFELFHTGYIDRNKSIIDVGCWLGDNAIPWSFLINDNAVVHAIDPSEENLDFGKKIAELNGQTNINWVEAVCAETVGEKLSYQGSLEQASFYKKSDSNNTLLSDNLDNIIKKSSFKSISLMHVDVEGFEIETLKGARDIIFKNKPVIIFEQHISSEDSRTLIKFLEDLNYKIFMINEVLPGCQLDCRNFIAFDRDKNLPLLPKVNHSEGTKMNIFYASLDEALIEVI